MKCPKCNFDNPASTNFCGNCGDQFLPYAKIQGFRVCWKRNKGIDIIRII
jgi:predicted amidophosphoribosyltransferase